MSRMKSRPRRLPLAIVTVLGLALGLALSAVGDMPEVPVLDVLRGPMPQNLIVIDGDTLKLDGQSIRLHGIDSPERRQTCDDGWPAAEEARRTLAAIVAAGPVLCDRVSTDRYGRTVGTCKVDGRDVGEAMVRAGMAWAYTDYSRRYVADEQRARLDRLGVHARQCASPAAWRTSHPRQPVR